MENKKASLHNTPQGPTSNELESIPKHQHNTPPQYIRYVQQTLKIPNNQQRQSPMIHQHMHAPYQPAAMNKHHIQIQYNSPNIHTNPLHIHYNNQYIYQQNQLKQHQQQQQQLLSPLSPMYHPQTVAPPAYNHPHNSIIQSSPQPWVPHTNLIYQKQQQLHQQQKSDPSLTPTTITSATTSTTPNTPVNSANANKFRELDRKKSSGSQQLRSPSAKRPTDAPVTIQGWLHKQGSDGLMLWKKRWFVLTEYVLFYYKGSEEEKLLGSILLPSYKVSICVPDDRINRKYAFKCEHTNMRTYILAADSHELMMQWIRVLNLACLLQSNVESDSMMYAHQNEHAHESHYAQERIPLHVHSSSNATDLSNPSQEMSQYNQPLYANAPPKPRRLNDTGYSSPSPELLDRYNEPKYVTLQPPPYLQQKHQHQQQQQQRVMQKSNSIYSNHHQDHQYHQGYIVQNAERRTPDTYGRSKSLQNGGRHPSDYEDIYAEQYMYKRPLSPLAYDKTIALTTPIQRTYLEPRTKSPNNIPRPHSADFLEYEATHRHNLQNLHPQPARPKSSLDINRNGNDNYFYSEERYAEKMRKSAQYLSKMPKYVTPAPRRPYEQDNTFPLMRSNTQPLNYPNSPIEYASVRKETPPTRCRSVLSEGSISKELDDLAATRQYKDALGMQQQDVYRSHDMREYDPFTRSASARLANIEQRLQGDGRASMNKEGERKREESMKRLLEWKQRMLQSPLNRKMNPNANKTYGKPEYYKKNNSYNARHLEQRLGMGPIHNQYNSYSSDDEENADGSTMQAGRTLDTSAPHTSISLLAPQTDTFLLAQQADLKLFTATDHNLAQLNGGSGALVKSILADFTTKPSDSAQVPETPMTPPPTKDIDAIIEENYMTMTPKKNAFDFASGQTTEMDENPYVEMTQGLTTSILDPNAHQSYELVTFSEGLAEPLYMELQQNKEKKTELPDILLPSVLTKSDSSDADDEASKDLESLYATNPRFSLSDNFRPASYYLGASQNTLPEHQDSSDSELVSPPPIPRSPPPMEELNAKSLSISSDLSLKLNKVKTNDLEHKDDTSCGSTQTDELADSDVDHYRHNMFKRRPVSDDSIYRAELASFDSEFDKATSDISKYLKKLDGELVFDNNTYHDYENMIVTKLPPPILPSELSRDTFKSEEVKILEAEIFGPVEKCQVSFAHKEKHLVYNVTAAPYYYSDLGLNTNALCGGGILKLNNQRGTNNGGKRDITHIVNPIRCNNLRQIASNTHTASEQFKLANEARSVSVDFLNLTDKCGQIDKKNVYESDTLKRLKATDEKFLLENFLAPHPQEVVRRSHSLEGLLENVLNDTNETVENSEGSYLWEEDSIWRETLRNASQRHTKSLDDLDCIGVGNETPKVKKSPRGLTRDVVYVNDNVYNHTVQAKDTEGKDKENFTIDREKLRQWDLMSSAPSDSQELSSRANTEIDFNAGDRPRTAQPSVAQEAASGSLSMNIRDSRDTFPRNSSNQRIHEQMFAQNQSRSTSNLNRSYDSDYGWQDYYMSRVPSQQNIELENRKISWNDKVKLSAGDLLGRTHEELVLLLIQLRRQSTNISHAIETGYNQIDAIQAQIHMMDAAKRMENLQKLEQIKQHLLDLEKQYEKGKPMVNLVDNMVKLGSLYRFPSDRSNYSTRLEFNQQMQEKKLLDEERRDWNRVNSNQEQLHEKVQQLYELDQMIQEGSGTLQSLQQDKEEIERALGGIRNRLMQGYNDPEIIEQAKKQQAMLENELSRVHLMLAQNSKKLEETVAGNARLEQELLVLKQKLQVSKQSRLSPQFSNAGDSLPCVIGTSAMLESDLQKVQQKVGDLRKQRQELSMQVRQLTDRSNHVKPFSPTQENRKKFQPLWRETDLDTMNIYDHGERDHWESISSIPSTINSLQSTTPLYIKTDLNLKPSMEDIYGRNYLETPPEDSQQLIPQEKQEIKTVRIVKRESERRHRDRDRDKLPLSKYDALCEDDYYTVSNSSPAQPAVQVQKAQSNTNLTFTDDSLSRTSSTPSISQYEKDSSPVLSPVFKSEAARQIITEMAQETPKQQTNRRAVPIGKRRHYTAPHNNLIMKSFNQLPTDDDTFNKAMLETRRARDDLDMERALRQRNDTPDVVRSTLSSKELKYNENTIDSILGTPNKIFIPERYIPEQLPQLSAEEEEHRLRKVESIKKMLSDSTILSTSTANLANTEDENAPSSSITHKATAKMIEEKKQREHLLQLNQVLAKQVMEMSKIVAVKALRKLPLESSAPNSDDDDLSPISPLPLYQQRDNFYS